VQAFAPPGSGTAIRIVPVILAGRKAYLELPMLLGRSLPRSRAVPLDR
jgi:hypothetical protein